MLSASKSDVSERDDGRFVGTVRTLISRFVNLPKIPSIPCSLRFSRQTGRETVTFLAFNTRKTKKKKKKPSIAKLIVYFLRRESVWGSVGPQDAGFGVDGFFIRRFLRRISSEYSFFFFFVRFSRSKRTMRARPFRRRQISVTRVFFFSDNRVLKI